jgi:ribose transport system substrate-binding protein
MTLKVSRSGLVMICAALLVSAVFLIGGASPLDAQKQKTIGLCMHFLQDDWSLTMKRGVEETAKKYGYKVLVNDANFDAARQMEQVESLITRKVDAIIVVALNTQELLSVLDKAQNRKIGVVGAGLPSDIFFDKKYLSDVWTDNHIMGVLAGRKMADLLALKGKKEAKIATINVPIGMYALTLRDRGFKFATVDEYPGFKIVAEEKAGTIEEAMRVAENLFTAYPDLDAIFGTAGTTLIGAARAKQAKGKTDLVLTGIDNDKEICKFVKLGIIDGAAVNNGYAFGVETVEVANKYFKDGTRTPVPIYISGPLLDASNVEDFYKQYYAEPLSKYMGK